jgi:hypothetical protein
MIGLLYILGMLVLQVLVNQIRHSTSDIVFYLGRNYNFYNLFTR